MPSSPIQPSLRIRTSQVMRYGCGHPLPLATTFQKMLGDTHPFGTLQALQAKFRDLHYFSSTNLPSRLFSSSRLFSTKRNLGSEHQLQTSELQELSLMPCSCAFQQDVGSFFSFHLPLQKPNSTTFLFFPWLRTSQNKARVLIPLKHTLMTLHGSRN